MSETLTVGLTKAQRDLLLQGLRYVRSSVALQIRDPDQEFLAERTRALKDIDSLVGQLAGDAGARR